MERLCGCSHGQLLHAACTCCTAAPPSSPLRLATSLLTQVVELLMLRSGCDVCCTTDADRSAIARYEAQLAAEASRAEVQ